MKTNPQFILACSLLGAIGLAAGSPSLSAQDAKAEDIKPPEKPKDAWNVTLALGFALTSGNSDTTLFTADGLGVKKWGQNVLTLHGFGAYGENEGDQNVGNAGFDAQYNRIFSDRWYGYGRFSAFEDSISRTRYRFTTGAGAGYFFIKNEKVLLSAEAGPGYVWQKLGDETDNYFTIRMAQDFEYKFTKTARIWESVEYLPQVDDWGNYIITATVGVESGLYKNVKLQVRARDIYQSRPAVDRESNDLQVTAGIAYSF